MQEVAPAQNATQNGRWSGGMSKAQRQVVCHGVSDTPRGLQPSGFSVHPPSQRRESPKALSAPLNVLGRVQIAVQDEAAVGADMRAHGQTLVYSCTAPAALLRGIRRVDRFHRRTILAAF